MTETKTSPILDQITESFNFGVSKLPLSGPDNMVTPCYGLFRDDRTDASAFLGSSSVTDRYLPHTTDDVLALCESVDVVFGGTADVSCHFDQGHYVQIQPSVDMRREIYGTKDNIFPRFLIKGGYGGNGGSFSCAIGMFVDKCSNMHIMRSVKSTVVSIRHTSGLRSKMDDLIDTVKNLKDGWENLFAAVERMEQNKVNLAEFLNSIYGMPSEEELALAASGTLVRKVTIHQNRTQDIISRIIKERNITGRNGGILHLDEAVTGWEAFNAVQWFTQHKASRRTGANDFSRILSANQGAGGKITAQAEALALAM